MVDQITPFIRSEETNYQISILLPSWNNLTYLRNCIASIRTHSSQKHQIIVFVNEGSDGTLEWLKELGDPQLDFMHSPVNMGICYAVNTCRTLARASRLVYMNDDMYVLPGWDAELLKRAELLDTPLYSLSATMIEPEPTRNNCVVVKDFGSDLENFREEELLKEHKNLVRPDWMGSTWPPVMLSVEAWDLVGGFSIEFSPGMYSDPDLSYKLVRAGTRHFIGVGSSLVYHFGSKTTGRVIKNRGRKQFLSKWGISSRVFRQRILNMGREYSGPIPEPDPRIAQRFLLRLKRVFSSW